jgi:hypothetical protein
VADVVMQQAQDEVDDGGLVPRARLCGIAADGCADNGEDAGTDDRADAEGGERDGAERFFEGVLGTLRVGDELVDRFGSEDLAWQGRSPRRQECLELGRLYPLV